MFCLVCVVCHLICRAKHHGWQDTYVFTKAMGEMVINALRGDIPVVTMRPSVIESTLNYPFPGWIQGNRLVTKLVHLMHVPTSYLMITPWFHERSLKMKSGWWIPISCTMAKARWAISSPILTAFSMWQCRQNIVGSPPRGIPRS